MARDDRHRVIVLSVLRDPPGSPSVKINIADSGGGVPSHLREQLFQPFATSKDDGLGLGLALCRSIVSLHGGEIWLSEDSPGLTCFSFTLRIHEEGRDGGK
jgi:two-component system sensor kinase FixL